RSRDAHSRADHRRGASAGRGHRRGPRARPARDAQLMTTIDPLPRPQVVGVFSPGIARIPHLRAFLGAERIVLRPTALSRVDCVVGWGRKANTARARRFASREGLPYLALEDGFLRSVGLGVDGAPPHSIVVDDLGVYYDATAPSRLER